MQLVGQHVISRRNPRYAVIDEAVFRSKNLYNAANYEYRQALIHQGKYLNYNEVQKRMQSHEAYKALPAKVSQQVLMVLDNNWKSFREALKAYYEDPSKFFERPRPLKYKHKTEGRNILVYTIQAISKRGLKEARDEYGQKEKLRLDRFLRTFNNEGSKVQLSEISKQPSEVMHESS